MLKRSMATSMVVTEQWRGPFVKLIFSIVRNEETPPVVESKEFNIAEMALVCFSFVWTEDKKNTLVRVKGKKHPSKKESVIKVNVACDALAYSKQFLCHEKRTGWARIGNKKPDTKCGGNVLLYVVEIGIQAYDTATPRCELLYEDDSFTDFNLSTEEGSVSVHRACMAAHSDVFKTMLSGVWRETTSGGINIKGLQVSLQTLQHLKRYMYLGTLPEEGLYPLLLIADCYMITRLKEECIRKLASKVTADNLVELLEFASDNKIADLTFAVLQLTPDGVVHSAFERNKETQRDTVCDESRGRYMKLVYSITSTDTQDEDHIEDLCIQDVAQLRIKFQTETKDNNLKVLIQFKKSYFKKDFTVKLNVECEATKFSEELDCTDNWTGYDEMGFLEPLDKDFDKDLEYRMEIRLVVAQAVYKPATLRCEMLYADKTFTDFHLITEEGSVPVHRACLAAHSEVFTTMLSEDWKETTNGCLLIKGLQISLQTLKDLKEYLYLGTLPKEGLRTLLLIADFYNIGHLKEECIWQLASTVTENNLMELLEFASDNKMVDLTFAILQVTPDNVVDSLYCRGVKGKVKKQIGISSTTCKKEERKKEDERQKEEEKKKKEEIIKKVVEERKREEDRKKKEEERKREEDRRKIEEDRNREEERKKKEEERKREEERKKKEEERKREEERRKKEQAARYPGIPGYNTAYHQGRY